MTNEDYEFYRSIIRMQQETIDTLMHLLDMQASKEQTK